MSTNEQRERRELWPIPTKNENTFEARNGYARRREMLEWIYSNTTGTFYVGVGYVQFERDDDALMFRLSKYHEHRKAESNNASTTVNQSKQGNSPF